MMPEKFSTEMRKIFFKDLSSRFSSKFAQYALTICFSTTSMVSAEEDLKTLMTRLCLYTDTDILYGGVLVTSSTTKKIHCHLILSAQTSPLYSYLELAKMRMFFQESDWKWVSKFMDRKNTSPWNLKEVFDVAGWCRYICTQQKIEEERAVLNLAKRRSARSHFCKQLRKVNLLKKNQKIDFSDLAWRLHLGPLYEDAAQHNIKFSTSSTAHVAIEYGGPYRDSQQVPLNQ